MDNRVDGPLIVGSILESDTDAALRSAKCVPAGCGLVELRGDELAAGELAGVIRRVGRPTIATYPERCPAGT